MRLTVAGIVLSWRYGMARASAVAAVRATTIRILVGFMPLSLGVFLISSSQGFQLEIVQRTNYADETRMGNEP
jgi:hypothetical protein